MTEALPDQKFENCLLYVSIAEARERAAKARRVVRDGLDPIEERKKERERPLAVTLAEAKKAGLKNKNAVKRWMGLLKHHVLPTIGDRPVEDIDQHIVKKTLQPI